MIPLDSDLMRSFLAVADSGSVTAAADRLGRTQSAVSMQIRRLEDSIGQPLFDRLPRGVALTARGVQLVPYARRVTSLLEEAATALRQKRPAPRACRLWRTPSGGGGEGALRLLYAATERAGA
jgi:DNA-binding transcriptional LysR family regulator